MNTQTWKRVGLVMAVMGALSLARAEQGQDDNAGKGGKPKKGDRPGSEQIMKRFDKDGDGQLNEAERTAMREEMKERRENRKGRPPREEIMKRFDKDGDGQLNEAERNVMREEMKRRHGQESGRNREELLKKFDADGDGQLSETEREAMRKEFEQRKKPNLD